jgi:C1A family cysteine protease
MTDNPYGLGALPSPPDDRDFDIGPLLAQAPDAALPDRYAVRRLGPVLDQGQTPMCVAYSSSSLKAMQDRLDQKVWFDFDEPTFFRRIGGTQYGAYTRAAMAEMLKVGYPTRNGNADRHRITAYYRVPVQAKAIKRVIRRLGPVLLSVDWAQSWFYPKRGGMLPAWDHSIGGHAVVCFGWNTKGLRIRNSWGEDWGRDGNATIPYAELDHIKEVWKSHDDIVKGQGR